jgi:hypothetical protein
MCLLCFLPTASRNFPPGHSGMSQLCTTRTLTSDMDASNHPCRHPTGRKNTERDPCPRYKHIYHSRAHWGVWNRCAAFCHTDLISISRLTGAERAEMSAVSSCLRTLSHNERSLCKVCRRWFSPSSAQHSKLAPRVRQRPRSMKSAGNPDIMRRFIELQNTDEDLDDFLVEEEETEQSNVKRGPAIDPANPRNTRVKTAEYIKSSVKLEQCPTDGLPEFAVIGRSNVGKSSLINLLTKDPKLALTSKQPGTLPTLQTHSNRML